MRFIWALFRHELKHSKQSANRPLENDSRDIGAAFAIRAPWSIRSASNSRTPEASSVKLAVKYRCVLGLLVSTYVVGWANNAVAEENAAVTATPNKPAPVETVKLTIHPMKESKPSLKIQLLPDPTEQLNGNAAVFYLKAIGFLEQESARDQVREIYKKSAEQANATDKNIGELPPHSYLEMHPRDYPKKEVREFLRLMSFQELPLREARRFNEYSMYRNLQLVDSPMGYLLPELQSLRELARIQRMRCRLAIAEDRIDDAIGVIGQQVTMSHHLGQDDFLVSYLVGAATLRIALDDTLLLLENANCPNLYWAFAQLPNPLISPERCLAVERQFLYMQVPKLKEIGTAPLPPEYWSVFLQDFSKRTAEIDQFNENDGVAVVSKLQGERRLESIRKLVTENAPQAKKYLLDRGILTAETIDSYPKEQLVFLALKDHYEVNRDEHFKWVNLPYQVARGKIPDANERLKSDREKYGWFTGVSNYLLPSIDQVNVVINRTRLRIALIQTIEAIRMAGAENGGKLIESLDQAPVPVPNDPFTNKPFSYQVTDGTAVISVDTPASEPSRIELRFAK